MSEQLFEKILSDLQEINFSGIISSFEGHEPLPDRGIFHFIEMISTKLPLGRITTPLLERVRASCNFIQNSGINTS